LGCQSHVHAQGYRVAALGSHKDEIPPELAPSLLVSIALWCVLGNASEQPRSEVPPYQV
jgi:hypothetical protein